MSCKHPKKEMMVDILDDNALFRMFPFFRGEDIVDIWIQETEDPGEPFMLALDNRIIEEDILIAQQDSAYDDDILRELDEQLQPLNFTIPIVNTHNLEVEYMIADDEFSFKGYGSQPQPTQPESQFSPLKITLKQHHNLITKLKQSNHHHLITKLK
uniref:Uncharacterized protein n=1 Tax=Chenopodium quinoa TaxID=63459 RepID=A0A803MN82_CHEQI